MKTTLRLTLLLGALVLASQCFAQSSYTASKVTSASSSTEVLTVQGISAVNVRLPKVINFKAFDAACSVACTITLERDGTAATTTALTPAPLNPESGPSTAVAFSASNVGSGTVLAQYTIPAGGQIAVNLAGKQLYSGVENLTLRSSSITGTVTLNIQWTEQQ